MDLQRLIKQMMILEHRNTPIFYTTRGRDNPIVLLHGFLESSEIWKDLVKGLATKRQVILIDLPGHGRSGCFAEIHTMPDMARMVKAVLDYLQVSNAVLVGHSMGGYVALEFHNLFPTIATGMLLINSTPQADNQERRINRERAKALVLRNKATYIHMAIANLLTPENNKKFEKELEELKKKAQAFPTEGITAALQGMKIRTDHTLLLKNFNRPKYIIAGETDPVLDHRELKFLAEACGSGFVTFPGGHLSYLEDQLLLKRFVHFID